MYTYLLGRKSQTPALGAAVMRWKGTNMSEMGQNLTECTTQVQDSLGQGEGELERGGSIGHSAPV